VVFDDEGHVFTKNANSISGYEAILGFLDTHLAAESGD
jgi:dipeptidyl aminopeptidase/acylaminoacyl peptidase